MIHELLLALRGYTGGLFVVSGAGGGLQVSLEALPPFLHPSEAGLLARACRLGAFYVRFSEFIEQFAEHVQPPLLPPSSTAPLAAPTQPPDLYSTQQGIYLRAFCTGLDTVLEPYRQALLDLEQEFLADPHLTISHVNYSLDQFQLLFPSLMIVVEQIKTQKIHGCQILEIVNRHSRGGLPPVRHALEKVLAMCHAVMYKQLSAWMLHGLLLDQHEEFFIKPEIDRRGEYVGPFSKAVLSTDRNVALLHPCSILKNQEDIFAAELHRLKQHLVFNLMDFESVVDWIRSTVAEHLWKLMVEESDLIGQLKIIKDFYLLGRGELFQAFIDTAQHMLKSPPTAVTEHDVNVAFQQSAHKVLLDDDNLLPLLHLTIHYHGKEHRDASQSREAPSRELSPHESPTSGWAALGLSYKVQWPLHILFTPAVLEKYNVVFKYLLSVRRVQAELQHCWALQTRGKCLQSSRTDAIKWRLRHHMTFLVDNLQYYLQVDVLESQFSQLLQQINATRDFESIRLAHDHFLSNLLAQSFILLKPAFHCLNEILDLCHSFCSLVSQNRGPLDERGTLQLSILAKGFSCQSSLLFKILSSVHNHQINSDLAQLLLRLDYNKYYTQAGGTLGSVGLE
ncbi:gamma-tubulin complex component 4 isoform X3 [Varanus komodoensis]|uniref:gamma-tubulin complex component 4 isoform X3 n=1 Tax=Varanus komodoensis TaxID=61221 RepID=UPI001CF7C3CB|nr:gamma-tubulin complex component 4 isoform X3 [Varanus komodoensis]